MPSLVLRPTPWPLLVVGLALLAASLACLHPGAPAPSIETAFMAFDGNEQRPAEVYAPDDTFYARVVLQDTGDKTMRLVWVAVQTQQHAPNTTLYETTLQAGAGPAWFSLQPNAGFWSLGDYRLDVYLDGQRLASLSFSVNYDPVFGS